MVDPLVDQTKMHFEKVVSFLKEELKKIHAGRASTEVVGDITLDVYGSKNKLKNVASVAMQGAREVIVEPWDKGLVKDIESGILKSPFHLTTKVESDARVRVMFPQPSQESRKDLVKILHQKKEQARVTLRHEREKAVKSIEDQFKAKAISEDRRFQLKKEVQKSLDEFTKEVDAIVASKEGEIMTV